MKNKSPCSLLRRKSTVRKEPVFAIIVRIFLGSSLEDNDSIAVNHVFSRTTLLKSYYVYFQKHMSPSVDSQISIFVSSRSCSAPKIVLGRFGKSRQTNFTRL